jgi:hypothetical protein
MPDPAFSANISPATIVTVGFFSVLGGLAYSCRRLSKEEYGPHWGLELLSDVLYSAVAGFSAWYITTGSGIPQDIALGVSLVAGHMGARWLVLVQRLVIEKVQQHTENGKAGGTNG